MPTLTVDSKEITVERGTRVIEAARKLGIEIPHYCYHPGLSIAGNCRMCLVEVDKFPKMQIACHLLTSEGMVVRTATEAVRKTRQHILEFLLVNHPLDCPVCDQAGECRLQDYYMEHGLYDSRFDEDKVKKKKAVSVGPTVMLDSERCILCSRCVRFTDEVSKTSEFGIFNRGDHAEIGVYPGKELDNKYSGNVVDICPVGALTDKDFRFKCRVWYLKQSPSVCPGCSMGCNMEIHYQTERRHIAGGDRVMRLKPRFNEAVNRWWMCDEGRYGYKPIDEDRISVPQVKAGKESTGGWEGALEAAAGKLAEIASKAWAVLASPQLTNEELYLVRKIFSEHLGLSVYLVSPSRQGYGDDFLMKADKNPNTRGAFELGLNAAPGQLEGLLEKTEQGVVKALYIFGQDLLEFLKRETADRLFLRCRDAVIFQGSNRNRTSEVSAILLASASYAEKEGTFTNCERRVQRIHEAFPPKGESRPDWEILTGLAARLGLPMPYRRPRDIFDEIAASVPAFRGMSYEKLGEKGAMLA